MRKSFALSSLALLLAGCGAPDISADIRAYGDQIDAANSRACDCFELLGYGGAVECTDALGDVGESEEQCIADVLEGNEADAQEYLQCAAAAMQGYADCLAANAACELGVYDQCTLDRDAELDACTGLSTDLRQAVGVCTVI